MLLQVEATSSGTWAAVTGLVALVLVNAGKWLSDSNRARNEREVNNQRHEMEVQLNQNKQMLFQRMADSNDKIVDKLADIKSGQSLVCKANCPNQTVINNTTSK